MESSLVLLRIDLSLCTLTNTASAVISGSFDLSADVPKRESDGLKAPGPACGALLLHQATAILKAASAPSSRPRTSCGGLSRHDPSAIRQACPATAARNGDSSRDPRGVKFPPDSANCDRCCRPVSPCFAQALALGEVVSNTGASLITRTAGTAHRRATMLSNYGAAPAFLFKVERRPA